MTVLTSDQIKERIFDENVEKRLVITPIGELEKRVCGGAVDLKLGTKFIIEKPTTHSGIDPLQMRDKIREIEKYQERIFVKPFCELILHPHQLVLGATLEYIKLPDDLIGYVIGRSSWGKTGLTIATATLVQPGYFGVLTLELINVGNVPITLYTCTRIGQLVLHTLENEDKLSYKGKGRKYLGSVGPEFTRIYSDEEFETIAKRQPKDTSRAVDAGSFSSD